MPGRRWDFYGLRQCVARPASWSGAVREFETLADLAACVGQHVATSDWVCITQAQIQCFADATGDQQWIHVDAQKAKAGPFGAPIAHGFLTLALLPQWLEKTVVVRQVSMGVNYGLNKVRFVSPVPVGSRLRAQLHLGAATALERGGWQMQWDVVMEREGDSRPVCVAQALLRLYP